MPTTKRVAESRLLEHLSRRLRTRGEGAWVRISKSAQLACHQSPACGGFLVFTDRFRWTFRHEIPAMDAATRSQLDQPIRDLRSHPDGAPPPALAVAPRRRIACSPVGRVVKTPVRDPPVSVESNECSGSDGKTSAKINFSWSFGTIREHFP